MQRTQGNNGRQEDVALAPEEYPNEIGAEIQGNLSTWRQAVGSPKKVAIVGKAPDTMKAAPWNDPSWDIWILNDMATLGEASRWNACFEIHSHPFTKDDAHRKWLSTKHGKPIFINKARPDVPDGITLPVDELQQLGRYYTNTVSWMIGLAILCRPEEIALYGVNMAQDDEYAHQRPSCEYYLGIAVGAGIRVQVPKQSDLLKCAVQYGIETSPILDKMAARKEELTARLNQARAQENHWTTQRIAVESMLLELSYWDTFAGKQA